MLFGILLYFGYLAKVRGLFVLFYFGVDLVDISFGYRINKQPNDPVDQNEKSKVFDKAQETMLHPTQKVCNG